MSDDFDHMTDAWDTPPWERNPPKRVNYRQLDYHGSGWSNTKPYINRVAHSLSYNLNKEADLKQPEYQQLIVRCVHRQTEKSYNVTGEIRFDLPFHGMRSFQYLADWIPKSQCIITGNKVRIPHWLVRKCIETRLRRDANFEGLFRQYEAMQQEHEDILRDSPF